MNSQTPLSDTLPRHTPYDGSDPLFRIGLQPLDLKNWIEVDDRLGEYLDEKERLAASIPEAVFVEEPDTRLAQQEALDLLVGHLGEHHRKSHVVSDGKVTMAGRTVRMDGDEPSLKTAAKLVQEDLILMRKGEAAWRLAAASLSFPSSWSLQEKFTKPLDEIHRPVPGFGPGTRNASLIERIFDNLPVSIPVRRLNWSVYSDDELFHDDRSAEHLKKGDLADASFLRIEHQTLRRLPKSGDILFTVRIHLDPFETLETHPRRIEICEGFISLLEAMQPEELAYKGLTQGVGGLIDRLRIVGGLSKCS